VRQSQFVIGSAERYDFTKIPRRFAFGPSLLAL